MGHINWARLLQQDRCNDIGVPWSAKELKAIYEEGIPPAYVRDGLFSTKEYKKILEEEEIEGKPFSRYAYDELTQYAAELGIEFVSGVSRASLQSLVEKAEEAGMTKEDPDAEVDGDGEDESTEEAKESAETNKPTEEAKAPPEDVGEAKVLPAPKLPTATPAPKVKPKERPTRRRGRR